MSGKRSPFKRTRNHFVLQERDKKILAALYRFRFLTNDQIQAFFDFGCLTRTNVRLRKLFDNQFLSRRFLTNPYGRAKILHFLGPEAIEIVAEKLRADPLIVRKKRRQVLKARDSSLNHQLLINKFRLALTLALRNNPQAGLEAWRNQKGAPLKSEKKFYTDAYFRLRFQNEVFNFFLEIDRSSRIRKQCHEKTEKYLKYGLEGWFEGQFGFRFFRVLIISPSQTRLENLLNVIERQTDKMFWLTTWEMVSPEKILTPIWFRPGKEELSSLLEVR